MQNTGPARLGRPGNQQDDGKMAAAPEGLKGNFNNVRRVFGPMAKDVKQYEAGKELAPGVTAVAAPGHTPGDTAYVVSSGSGKLILLGPVQLSPNVAQRRRRHLPEVGLEARDDALVHVASLS